jgi:hypothetical protein
MTVRHLAAFACWGTISDPEGWREHLSYINNISPAYWTERNPDFVFQLEQSSCIILCFVSLSFLYASRRFLPIFLGRAIQHPWTWPASKAMSLQVGTIFLRLSRPILTVRIRPQNSAVVAEIKNVTFSIGMFSLHDPAATGLQFHYTSPEIVNAPNGTRKVDEDSNIALQVSPKSSRYWLVCWSWKSPIGIGPLPIFFPLLPNFLKANPEKMTPYTTYNGIKLLLVL